MAVDDHGIEVLKKSGEEVTPGNKSDMYIKTSVIASALPTGAATEATLTSILSSVDQLEGFVDGLEGFTDGLETLLNGIKTAANNIEGYTDGLEALLGTIRDNADGIESLLISIGGFTDGIEGLLTTIRDNADTLESLVTSGNASLASIDGKLNSLGQKIMANSIPVTIASDQSQYPVTAGMVQLPTSDVDALNEDLVAAIDVSNYSMITLQISSFVGTLTFQGSNDNSVFFSVTGQTISAVNTQPTTATASAGIYKIPVLFKFFRARATTYTSGTLSGTCHALANSPIHLGAVAVNEADPFTVQPGNTPNTTPWLVIARGHQGTTTSTAVTATSTSTTALAANANRKYLLIRNSENAAIWITFTSAAVAAPPSIKIQGGSSFVQEGNFISTEAITVIRDSGSNVVFTIVEGV